MFAWQKALICIWQRQLVSLLPEFRHTHVRVHSERDPAIDACSAVTTDAVLIALYNACISVDNFTLRCGNLTLLTPGSLWVVGDVIGRVEQSQHRPL